ncbi:MAG TPA: collagen-like protein, partial [Nostocaceae cyanobacterium]|nr:collagen-like protein [Nostocaceae cyanobacterium]
ADIGSKQITLSKNKWLLRRGATALLAIGSVIDDEYREFAGRIEGNFQLLWQERQPITSFANQQVTLNLNDNQEIELDFSEDLWLAGNSNIQGNLTQFTVTNAIEKKDVTKLAVSDFADSGQNLNLKIVDLASKSDSLNTQFRIKYRARDEFGGAFDYRTVYEGDIPSELVTRDYNRFILALGKLKIPSDALRPGVNVDIELVATRSLGKRSAQQTLKWQGNVRKSR